MSTACVVVPTKNEGPNVVKVISDIQSVMSTTKYDRTIVLVVDDSTDDTRRLAASAGGVVVRGDGDGLGSAMYKGLKAAASYRPDVILAVDGDGQADAEEIPRFLAPIENDEADMVLGSRFLDQDSVKYHYKGINRLGTVVLSWILRKLTHLPLTDSHGGLRAMRPEVAESLDMLGTHTYVQETIIDANEKGFRIKELPSVWKKREHGSSRVVGSIPKYIFYTLPILILRSGQHIRALYSLGLLFILLSLLYFLLVLLEESFSFQLFHRTPAFILISLLISLGTQFFFFGLVLQLLKGIKKSADRAEINASGPRPPISHGKLGNESKD